MSERLFLDTAFIQALLNHRDQYHTQAKEMLPIVRAANEVWVTEAVLVEVGNALTNSNRMAAAQFIHQCYQTENMRVVDITSSLFAKALSFYAARSDKTWGLTDCLSFVVMESENLELAVTADRHFIQAGFRALLTEVK